MDRGCDQLVQRFVTTGRTIVLSKSKTRIIEIKSSQQQDSACTCEACLRWQKVDAMIQESKLCEKSSDVQPLEDVQLDLSPEAKAMTEIYEKYGSMEQCGDLVPKTQRTTDAVGICKPRSYRRLFQNIEIIFNFIYSIVYLLHYLQGQGC